MIEDLQSESPGQKLDIPQNLTSGLTTPKILLVNPFTEISLFNDYINFNLASPKTKLTYASALTVFFRYCDEIGVKSLKDISTKHLKAFLDYRTHELGYGASNRIYYSAVCGFVDHLIFEGYFYPDKKIRLKYTFLKASEGKTGVINKDDINALFESLKSKTRVKDIRDKALISIMLHSFCRISGLLSCNFQDYKCENNDYFLYLVEKGNKQHKILLYGHALKYFEKYLHHVNVIGPKTPLFQSMDGRKNSLSGRRLTATVARRAMTKCGQNAGLNKRLTNHTFRATGITLFLEKGGNIEDAQALANHSCITTTQRYDRRNKKRLIAVSRAFTYE